MEHPQEAVDYQVFYNKRLKGLEELKKRLAAQQLSTSSAVAAADKGSDVASPNANGTASTFNALRAKMVSLMEHDVMLMRQLLALNATIETMKLDHDDESLSEEDDYYEHAGRFGRYSHLSGHSSQTSLTTLREDDERLVNGDGATASAVSQFLVNEDGDVLKDANERQRLVSRQFFSRHNSVLRIPIQPSHGGDTSVRQHPPKRSVVTPSAGGGSSASTLTSSSSLSSRASSGRSLSSSTSSSAGGRRSTALPDVEDHQRQPATTSVVTAAPVRRGGDGGGLWHESDSSVDSGIAEERPPPSRGSTCLVLAKELASQQTAVHDEEDEYEQEVFV